MSPITLETLLAERDSLRARLTTAETERDDLLVACEDYRDDVRRLTATARAAEARVDAAERECGQLHGWYSDAQKQVEALREAVGIFLDACGLAEPLDEFHPDVLVFNETPTVHLRTACRVARAALDCPPQQPEKVEGRASSDNQKRVAAFCPEPSPAARSAFNAWCERAFIAADDPDAPHTEAYFAGYHDGLAACPPPEEEK